MLTVTFLVACFFGLGLLVSHAPGRASDEPPATVTVTTRVAATYRGHTIRQLAAVIRHRTRQLQAANGRTKRLQRVLAVRLLQPAYGTATLERAFLCIHRYEGAWTDNGAPFWGGLQMDSSFQSTYASWAVAAFGTADRWPVSVQIATAIRAYTSGRGFYPWPNTARYCGLI